MKEKMKNLMKKHQKDMIYTGIMAVLGFAFWIWQKHPLWMFLMYIVFLGLYYALRIFKFSIKEKSEVRWNILVFLLGAAFTVFAVQFLLLEPELFVKTKIEKWFYNYICILLGYLFCLLVTNRVGISCVISHVFYLFLAYLDYVVYSLRQNEIGFSDLKAAGTGLSVAANYEIHFSWQCVLMLFLSILYICFARKIKIRYKKRLHMSILSGLSIVLSIVFLLYVTSDIKTETWEMKGTYKNGLILNLGLGIRDSFVKAPQGYSEEKIKELEEEYQADGSSYVDEVEAKDPTIIVIMNESFADLSVLGELKTNEPLMPFLNSLKENTIKGTALASVFGAKTPNSEWEYMTGNSMAFLPEGSVVYQQYISNTPTSIVSTLKNQGYTCVATHPYYETGWSRNSVYPTMGFDEMYFLDDFDQSESSIARRYVKDSVQYDFIIDRFEEKEENEKLFMMNITMQNHGGYTETYDNFPENYYKMGTSYTDVNQYLSLVKESDNAIRELVEYFQNVEEPVEIVFFGDHQPSLNKAFYKLMNGKGMSGLSKSEMENLYKVPFFIWTNYESESKTIPITSLNYLSTMTLQRAGIALPAYNQFLAEMMEKVPAINSRGYYSSTEGTYLSIEDAKGEEAEWIKKYEMLQYNCMFDSKGISKQFFPYLE